MNARAVINGPESAIERHTALSSGVAPPSGLSTVFELINAIDAIAGKKEKMLRTTALRIADFKGVPPESLAIDDLVDIDFAFGEFLKERRYKLNSIQTYRQNTRRLLRRAEELGWLSGNLAVAESWQPIMNALMAAPRSPKNLVRYAIARGKRPADFSDADFKAWGESMIGRGRKAVTVRLLKWLFRKAILAAGLEGAMPRFDCRADTNQLSSTHKRNAGTTSK